MMRLNWKKYLVIPALILVLLGPVFAPFAESFNFPSRYDLVAVLVEQGLYRDENDYDGLFGVAAGPILRTNIKARVDRYAIDLQNALPGTRAVIIQVDRFEDPANIATVLERLYYEGDPKEPTRVAYLKGVVVVGEVPLPVVNKAGNRFISLFPYTDFDQKAYVWNPSTRDFEIRTENASPQPEIWHGVIRPPVPTQTPEGKGLIAAYFDKNHLYHVGDDAYSQFAKRVFFQDFAEENKNLNAVAYKNYLQFLEHEGDVAYMRYTKELYKDLAAQIEGDMAADAAESDDLTDQLLAMGIPVDTNVPKPNLPAGVQQAAAGGGVNKNDIPDIMTKVGKMSDNLMFRFNQLFTKYPSLINDFIKYTGRYTTLGEDKSLSMDVDSAVNLITLKDEYELLYLKGVNDMVEKKIDEFVNRLQKNVLLASARIVAQYVDRKAERAPFPILDGIKPAFEFANFSPEFKNANDARFQNSLNGYLIENVNSVNQCTPYRGSNGDGAYSKLVEINRALNEKSGFEYDRDTDSTTGRTPEEKSAGYQCHYDGGRQACEGYEHFGGCFYDGSGHLYDNPEPGVQVCFPEHATDPVFDVNGTRAVAAGTAPLNYDNFRSCLNFHETTQYIAYLNTVDERLENIDDEYDWSRATKIGKLNAVALAPKDLHPDSIKLFTSTNIADPFEVTLGQVLRGLGWNAVANPEGWRQTLLSLITSDLPPNDRKIQIQHDKIVDIGLILTRPIERQISSVMYHKEPTKDTLGKQAINMISKELPVDNPRYVTFQNKVGAVARIDYPDLFKEQSFDAYVSKLREIENQINALPRDPNTPAPCQNCLLGLITNLPERASFPAGEDIVVERANSTKVQDMLNWKNMDIDSKHSYIVQYYLDPRPTKDAYTGESANGYELAYLNGEGAADKYAFSLNKDSQEETDPAFDKDGAGAPEKEAPYEDDPGNKFDDDPPEDTSAQGGYDLFSWSPPPVSPWWERMKEWKNGLKETNLEVSFGESQEEFYGKLDSEAKKMAEDTENERSEAETFLSNGVSPNFSKIDVVTLKSDSGMIVTGKMAEVELELKDKDGGLVNDEFAKLTLVLEGGGSLSSDVKDDDPTTPGTQITMMSGSKSIGIVAPDTPAELKLTVEMTGADKKAQTNVAVVANAALDIKTQTFGVVANGANQIPLEIRAVDEKGQILTNYNGLVRIGVSDTMMGEVIQKEVSLVAGKGECTFKAGKKKGKVIVNAVSSALDPGKLELSLLPGAPVSIALASDSEVLENAPGSEVQIEARIFDANGNIVDTNSAAQIDFRITEKTSAYGSLSSMSEVVKNGVASVRLRPREKTGIVNIIAEARGLSSASMSIKSAKTFGVADVTQLRPEVLAASVLGIPGGNVVERNYFGGWFVMNGKTQVVNSLTAQPKQYKKLFEVNDNGGVLIPDPARIGVNTLSANNLTMVFRDNQTQLDLAEVTIYALKEGKFDVTETADTETLADGVYMKKTSSDHAYKVDRTKGALRVVKADSERIEIQTNGFLRIFDNDFSVKPINGKFLTLQVLDKGTAVAEIYFVQRFSQDVKIQNEISDAPGVYVLPSKLPPQFIFESTVQGHSSANPRGVAFFDKKEEVKGQSAPGFAFQSLEDSLDRFGVGFTEDNKFALLFSGGETFGEANRPYASDIGIVLGDPAVRINNVKDGTFSSDIGKLAYTASSDVRSILTIDYNNDGLQDILILEGEGRLRLLQNNGGYDQLKDQGYILDIKNGIQDITPIDYNNDHQMDLAVAGKVGCRKGDTCIDVYENKGGAFVRHNLHFDADSDKKEMVVTLKSEDMNVDGYQDLVFADAAGDIRILYNRRGQFDVRSQFVGNLGLQVDPTKNLIGNVLLHYPGMATKDLTNPESAQKYQTLSTNEDFIYADLDTGIFSGSMKFGQDVNGEVVRKGDVIRYTIVLQNSSPTAKLGVEVSDVISDQVELNKDSIKCSDCAANEMKIEPLNSEAARPYLFKNINVPAFSSRRIVYETTYKGDTGSADKINFAFSNTFADENAAVQSLLKQDRYPDISATKSGNPTGRVRYYYTTGIDRSGNLRWGTELSSPPKEMTVDEVNAKTGLNIPNIDDITNTIPVKCRLEDPPREIKADSNRACLNLGGTPGDAVGPPRAATDGLGQLNQDSDNDGLPDSIDDVKRGLDNLAGATSAAVSKLTCDAGCLALPLNVSFLTPGFFSVLGVPSGFDVGLPVFGWGAPNIIPTWPPTPYMATAGGRFYVSPTLTGGVGFALCLGPYATPKNCYSFGINPLDLIPGDLCGKLNGAVSGALAAANSVVGKVNEGLTVSIGGNGSGLGTGGRSASGSGLGNYSLGSYESPVSKSVNVRIPGFPSVVTDWMSRQWEEITDKALAIPDIYLILPSPSSIGGAVMPTENFGRTGDFLTNILSWVNSIPLIDIETQEVLIKVPLVTRNEIEKFKADARQWLADEQQELDHWMNIMGCVGITQGVQALIPGTSTKSVPVGNILNADLCRFVSVEMDKLRKSVTQNMKALDDWILFPKKILQFRAIESYYVGQVIDYLDTVMEFAGGWAKRNTARVAQWRKAIRDIRQAIESWKAIFEVMIEYNESCDKCKTERYSLKDLILKLFIGIPSPPVIPIPKLPDIIVDVSKIQAGLKIQWPDVKFKAEPLTLPRLPRISLGVGLTIPQFKLMVPQIPVIPSPPDIIPKFPALPKINLPKLPDLPPPPKMPGLPPQIKVMTDLLKKIVKILCIIRLGFLPTDEMLLKTRIEEITARGLTPVLPIDTLFTVQSPTIKRTYMDQLIITAFTNLQMDTAYVQKLAEKVAQEVNKFSTGITKGINKFTDNLSEQLEKVTSPTLNINIDSNGAKLNYLDEKDLGDMLSKAFGQDTSELVKYGMQLRATVDSLSGVSEDHTQIISEMPKEFRLQASNVEYDPSKKVALSDEDIVLPFQKRLKEYRDHLADYNHEGAGADINDLSRFIAAQKSPFIAGSLKKYLATSDLEAIISVDAGEPVKAGEFDLLAFNLPALPDLPIGGLGVDQNIPGMGGPSGVGTVRDIGLFYVDQNGESRRLIDYTFEASKNSQLADIDIDNDNDTDKIYSYGPNVFIKKNELDTPAEARPTFRPVDLEFWTIFELLPKGGSPNYPRSLNETVTEASFNFEKPAMKNVAGFEVIAKNSPFFFESPGNHQTIRAHLLPDAGTASVSPVETVLMRDADGEVFINDAVPETATVRIGDKIRTEKKSSVTLSANDGTTIYVEENTQFTLSINGIFEVIKGDVEIEQSKPGSVLFAGGRILRASDGTIRMRFFDGSDITIESGKQFELPSIEEASAVLKSAGGSAMFTGQKRDYVQSGNGKVRIAAGEILHPLQTVTLQWDIGGQSEHELKLSKNILVPVSGSYGNGVDIEVEDGLLEVIKLEKVTQPIAAGMALLFGDQIKINNGSIEVHYSNGGDTVLRGNETYTLNKLEDFENPTISLTLDPAFYFTKVYAFDSDGNRSNPSEKVMLAPQVCGDITPPLANFGSTSFEIAVGKILKLDASRSFDSMGKVISYYLDVDTAVDSDGDGTANNDKDLWTDKDPNVDSDLDGIAGNDGDAQVFAIGPYETVGEKQMRLVVRDEALNDGYQDIKVKVVTPRIVLDAPPLRSGVISGFVEPTEGNVPITIAKFRTGTSSLGWEMIKTPSADAGGQYYTDAEGKFKIEDADLRNRLVIRNSEGKIVAEINSETGRVIVIDDRYEVRVIPSVPPNFGVKVGLFLKADISIDNPMTFVYLAPDVNTDTSIDSVDTEYDEAAAVRMSGVHIKPLRKAYDLGFKFRILPGDDTQIPGATVVEKENKRVAVVDVNGDIILSDSGLTLRVKPQVKAGFAGEEPVVFELTFNGESIAEIFVAAHLDMQRQVQIVDAPHPPLRPKPKSTTTPETAPKEFSDVSKNDPLAETLDKLVSRGIVAGYPSEARDELLFKPENLINRAEFTQIALKMLCIVPRAEAKVLPSPFYDVIDPKLWFYSTLKEGNIRGFIKGYLGEKKIGADGVERAPFKPANRITRAEATTVVLAALAEEDIVDFSKINFTPKEGANWYDKYMEIGQNLKPYLKKPKGDERAFLITAEEAASPNKEITRREFAIMADRVLLMYDCFDPDVDDDKLPDAWEMKYVPNITDMKPEEDADGDKCSNAKEYELGTDPKTADTDKGGVADCEESGRGTDPLNPYDDRPQALPEMPKNEEGIFVLRPACGDVCPCRATMGDGSDLLGGDIIFAAITGPNGLPIYAKSNEEKY